jgi:hypothetical protein
VLEQRADLLARLYADQPQPDVVLIPREVTRQQQTAA